MPDIVIVAKVLDDFGDDWHWVVLQDAQPVSRGQVRAARVVTRCGIELDAGPVVVTLHDTGAPDVPDCPQCLDREASPSIRERETVEA